MLPSARPDAKNGVYAFFYIGGPVSVHRVPKEVVVYASARCANFPCRSKEDGKAARSVFRPAPADQIHRYISNLVFLHLGVPRSKLQVEIPIAHVIAEIHEDERMIKLMSFQNERAVLLVAKVLAKWSRMLRSGGEKKYELLCEQLLDVSAYPVKEVGP